MTFKAEIGVVCSHPKETRTVAALLDGAKRAQFSLFTGFCGILENRPCAVIESGMGGDRAYIAAKQLIGLFQPEMILDFGVAAGVHNGLNVGSVVMAVKAAEVSPLIKEWAKIDPFFITPPKFAKEPILKEIIIAPPPELISAFDGWEKIKEGAVGSADFFLEHSLVKKELSKRGVDAFCYETFAVIQSSREAGVPALSIRGISDNGEEDAHRQFRGGLNAALSSLADILVRLAAIKMAFPKPEFSAP